MRRQISILIAVLFSFTLLSLNPSFTNADVGEFPEEGGTITPGDKNDKITMQSEKVVFDIKIPNENSPFYDDAFDTDGYGPHYAEVTADFVMKNESSENVTLDLMFPAPENVTTMTYYDPSGYGNQSYNFEITVNDEPIEFSYEILDVESFKQNPDFENEKVLAMKFSTTFPGNEATTITVKYDNRLVNEPKSIYGTFNYIMETGSHWKDEIGSGEIIFRFPGNITPAMFKEINDFFEINGSELIWKFSNLEPNSSHNIKVTYSPELLKNWESQPSYIKNITSAGDLVLSWSNIPDTDEYKPIGNLGFKGSIEGSTTYLTLPIDEDPTDGWLAKFDETEKPWVKYEFDGTYKSYSMSILSGISSENYIDAPGLNPEGKTSHFHTLLSRPKIVTLEFSDGSKETVNLKDTPAEVQKSAFDEVETSFVKVTVDEVYPGETIDENILGIGRMNFEVGDKVAETEEKPTVTTPPVVTVKKDSLIERLTVGDLRMVTIGGLVLVAIALFVVMGLIRSKRMKREEAQKLETQQKEEPSLKDKMTSKPETENQE